MVNDEYSASSFEVRGTKRIEVDRGGDKQDFIRNIAL